VRGLVLDRDDRVLLVQFRDAVGQIWWATPGGGVEDDEAPEETLRRELREEAGLREFEVGPEVWRREAVFAWDRRILGQRERIFLVRVDAHEPAPEVDLGAEWVAGLRWWTLEELERVTETIVPARLVELVRALLRDGPPPDPIDAGV
jgi:8-oxo-dGTP pyrophosphatase MutT (NUDIX family)